MSDKRIILLGAGVGSIVGGLVPSIWGASPFSLSSVFFGAVGAFVGIWFAYQLTRKL